MKGDVIFITNIGSKDLKVPSLPSLNRETRKISKEIKENIGLFQDEIELPIIMPSLIKIGEEVDKIDVIFLFVTNQEPQHKGDTIFSGEIIRDILLNPEKFKKIKDIFDNEEKFKKFKQKLPDSKKYIRIEEIKREVSDYDSMIEFYEDFFTRLKGLYENKLKREIDKIYISITGGIPACNTGLLWSGIKVFKEKIIPLYVKEGTEHAFELRVGDIIIESFTEETKLNFLKKRVFIGVESFEKNSVRKNLIRYIRERLNFNFSLAKKYLEKVEKEAGIDEKEYITYQFKELREISKIENKLNELYFNLKYKYDMGEYVDFLGRVYSFLGNFAEYILIRILKVNMEDEKKFSQWVKDKKDLYLHLTEKGIRIERNLKVYQEIMRFYSNKEEFLREFLDYAEKIQNTLINKRHRTIIAHGYEGCSLEEIKNDAEEFFRNTESLMKKLNIYREVDFIDKFLKLYK